ncbi:unnamed protein product [Closterium sp. Naga37s-1]|nr:unnamed protein product [Closterium sp. Naga37s-1]
MSGGFIREAVLSHCQPHVPELSSSDGAATPLPAVPFLLSSNSVIRGKWRYQDSPAAAAAAAVAVAVADGNDTSSSPAAADGSAAGSAGQPAVRHKVLTTDSGAFDFWTEHVVPTENGTLDVGALVYITSQTEWAESYMGTVVVRAEGYFSMRAGVLCMVGCQSRLGGGGGGGEGEESAEAEDPYADPRRCNMLIVLKFKAKNEAKNEVCDVRGGSRCLVVRCGARRSGGRTPKSRRRSAWSGLQCGFLRASPGILPPPCPSISLCLFPPIPPPHRQAEWRKNAQEQAVERLERIAVAKFGVNGEGQSNAAAAAAAAAGSNGGGEGGQGEAGAAGGGAGAAAAAGAAAGVGVIDPHTLKERTDITKADLLDELGSEVDDTSIVADVLVMEGTVTSTIPAEQAGEGSEFFGPLTVAGETESLTQQAELFDWDMVVSAVLSAFQALAVFSQVLHVRSHPHAHFTSLTMIATQIIVFASFWLRDLYYPLSFLSSDVLSYLLTQLATLPHAIEFLTLLLYVLLFVSVERKRKRAASAYAAAASGLPVSPSSSAAIYASRPAFSPSSPSSASSRSPSSSSSSFSISSASSHPGRTAPKSTPPRITAPPGETFGTHTTTTHHSQQQPVQLLPPPSDAYVALTIMGMVGVGGGILYVWDATDVLLQLAHFLFLLPQSIAFAIWQPPLAACRGVTLKFAVGNWAAQSIWLLFHCWLPRLLEYDALFPFPTPANSSPPSPPPAHATLSPFSPSPSGLSLTAGSPGCSDTTRSSPSPTPTNSTPHPNPPLPRRMPLFLFPPQSIWLVFDCWRPRLLGYDALFPFPHAYFWPFFIIMTWHLAVFLTQWKFGPLCVTNTSLHGYAAVPSSNAEVDGVGNGAV